MNPASVIWRVNLPEMLGLFGLGADDIDADTLGNVYVTDSTNGRVYKISPDSEPLETFSVIYPGEGTDRLNITVVDDSTFYVTDPANETLLRYDQSGSLVGEIWAPGLLDVCAGGDGMVYVLSNAQGIERIDCYDPSGTLVDVLSAPANESLLPYAETATMDADNEGNVYISHGMPPYRIWRVRSDSMGPDAIGRELEFPQDAILVADIAVDPETGRLWSLLSCRETGVQIIDCFMDGEHACTVGASTNDNFYGAICIAGGDCLYLLDTMTGELAKVSVAI